MTNAVQSSANATQSFPLTHDNAPCIMSNTTLYKEANTMPTKKSISQLRYDQQSCTKYGMKLNNKTDADIIAMIEKQNGFQAYIKRLIREDIERNGQPEPSEE